MPMRNIINHLDNKKREKLGELFRFVCVGGVATLLQYILYVVLLQWLNHNIANTLAYLMSFVFNFWASTVFTSKVKANAKKGIGFAFSHLVNYALQMGCLNLFIYLDVPQQIAPLPMFAVCVPVNFLLVRFFLKK